MTPSTANALHAQALIETADPTDVGERLAQAFAGEWRASAGSLHIGDVTVDLHAWPDGIRVDAYAPGDETLHQAEASLGAALDRLHERAPAWRVRPSTVPGAPPPAYPVYTFPHDDDHD
jgi:hypothetical protein